MEGLNKSPTGITGFDQITGGGLPRGRPTLFCGGAGSGKTLFALEFLVSGAEKFDEPGVFMSFEESGKELVENTASLEFDLSSLVESEKIHIDQVRIDRSETREAGHYDLEGLFIRLGNAVDSAGAQRVVLDSLEALFSDLSDRSVIRSELRRLFLWLKERGLTAVITGEKGDGAMTRYGLEEYISDCVIYLDHRVDNQISTRRLRVVKYRGSEHDTNEFPFLIDSRGIIVFPVTEASLDYQGFREKLSSGVPELDDLLEGKGFYEGSSIIVSGTIGTGKTTLASHFADECCRRGEKCIYFAFEESPGQLFRNMESIGIDLKSWEKKGRLKVQAQRATVYGLESHLNRITRLVEEFSPRTVVFDTLSIFLEIGFQPEVQVMLVRLIDFLKEKGITSMLLLEMSPDRPERSSALNMSTMSDTWIVLRDQEAESELVRELYILKARGISHSRKLHRFELTNEGLKIFENGEKNRKQHYE